MEDTTLQQITFFTSVHLAGLLSQQNMTIAGIICANNKGLTRSITGG